MLVVPSKTGVRNLKEFVALGRSQPGKLNYDSAGQATTTHLVMATFATRENLQMAHIPFKGNGPATTAVLAGEVQALFGALPPLLPHVQAGRLRALAISSAKRSPAVADVPTVAESGYLGLDMTLWLGFFAARGTPRAIVTWLEADLVSVAQSPDTGEQMTRQGLDAYGLRAAALAKLLHAEIETYKRVFKVAGIKLE